VRRRTYLDRQRRAGLLFVLPALAYFSLVFLVPLVESVIASFYRTVPGGASRFVGLRLYEKVLTDSTFWQSVRNTLTLLAWSAPATIVLALIVALGLHRLPLANGGRMVEVFESGSFRHAGHVERDARELRGFRVGLGVRSEISVPLEIATQRAGVLTAVSVAPEFFSESDLRFLATVSHWVGIVAQRAELRQQTSSEADARGRRAAAAAARSSDSCRGSARATTARAASASSSLSA